jgi:hypothetical protein
VYLQNARCNNKDVTSICSSQLADKFFMIFIFPLTQCVFFVELIKGEETLNCIRVVCIQYRWNFSWVRDTSLPIYSVGSQVYVRMYSICCWHNKQNEWSARTFTGAFPCSMSAVTIVFSRRAWWWLVKVETCCPQVYIRIIKKNLVVLDGTWSPQTRS